jgi:hypothetical protein
MGVQDFAYGSGTPWEVYGCRLTSFWLSHSLTYFPVAAAHAMVLKTG